MSVFMLFVGEYYYPEGGLDDLLGAYASADEARAALLTVGPRRDDYGTQSAWAHIGRVDRGGGEILEHWRFEHRVWSRCEPYDNDDPDGPRWALGNLAKLEPPLPRDPRFVDVPTYASFDFSVPVGSVMSFEDLGAAGDA